MNCFYIFIQVEIIELFQTHLGNKFNPNNIETFVKMMKKLIFTNEQAPKVNKVIIGSINNVKLIKPITSNQVIIENMIFEKDKKDKDGKDKKWESTSYSYGEEGNLIKIYLPLGQKYEVKVNNLVSASLYRFDSLLDSYTLLEEFAKDIVISR